MSGVHGTAGPLANASDPASASANTRGGTGASDAASTAAPARPFIDITDLSVVYRTRAGERLRAVDGFTLQVPEGEFCVIVGPSGCGKSTLLKVLAGLVHADGGHASIGGAPAGEPREDIGFVFQSATLLPWMSVLDNVLLPLKVQRRAERARWTERAMALLDVVGLADFAKSYPSELSGGMQQRVGMARALIHEPSLLLMDEPFGALDALTRETMNAELQRIWTLHRKTVLFVTHSISEAVFLADRVLVMSPRPGTIVADIAVALERPRDVKTIDSQAFTEYSRQVRAALYAREK